MAIPSRPSRTVKPIGETRLVSVPPTLAAPGQPGDQARDADYVYFYTGDGTTHSWRRAAIADWITEA